MRHQQWYVNAFAQIWGLFMCLLGCAALWQVGEVANQEYLHLIETQKRASLPPDFMIGLAVTGAVFVAAGIGLFILGARGRKKFQPIAIEVPEDSN